MKAIATSSTPPPCPDCGLSGVGPGMLRSCRTCRGEGCALCAECGASAVVMLPPGESWAEPACAECADEWLAGTVRGGGCETYRAEAYGLETLHAHIRRSLGLSGTGNPDVDAMHAALARVREAFGA